MDYMIDEPTERQFMLDGKILHCHRCGFDYRDDDMCECPEPTPCKRCGEVEGTEKHPGFHGLICICCNDDLGEEPSDEQVYRDSRTNTGGPSWERS